VWQFFYQTVRSKFKTIQEIQRTFVFAILIIILSFTIASAQSNLSLIGFIYDQDDGSAIQNATIEVVELGQSLSSDDLGFFAFEHVPPGLYSIKISADGYSDTTITYLDIEPDITSRIKINLSPIIYELKKIVVRSKKNENLVSTTDQVTIISRREIQQSNSNDISEILESVEGISVQKTGPAGGSQIRIRGSNPSHVLVLLDGQKLNPSGGGIADLSGIPVESIERIELHKGGAGAEFGPDALAGAINIITRPVKLFSNITFGGQKDIGDWNTRNTEMIISNPISIKNFSSRYCYLSKESDGDFDYNYPIAESENGDSFYSGTRINNSSRSDNIFVSGIFKPSEKITLNYSGRYYNSKHGLPDRATRPYETAAMTDLRKMLTAGINYDISNIHKLNFEYGYSQFDQHFLNNDTPSFLRFDSKFTNDIYTLSHNQSYSFIDGNLSRFSIMYRDELLHQTDYLRPLESMGQTSRNNFSTHISTTQKADLTQTKLFDIISLDAALRFDLSHTKKDSTSYADTVKTNSTEQLSPKFGIALSKGDRFSYVLRASYGKSFRLPTLNALFWKSDTRSSGNPGLKPEKSEHSEAGIELKLDFNKIIISGGMTYFHSFVRDLVVWSQNTQGIWRPENLALSQTTGHEDFVHINLFNNKIKLSYQNSITTALNKTEGDNSFGKRLMFAPHYITTFSARINLSPLFCSYSIRLVDRAFNVKANSRPPYPAYRLDDVHFGLNYDLSNNWQVSLSAKIDNIYNSNYVLMTHYPMPGRQWNISFGLNYNIGKENK
ncbi:MAG: TonB-dependent receptor, partial [candidate division Zixibacteria bacterium]|nr:TonB-dependent receptor [candidate division Zixibacteria bacterium]